MTMSCQVMTPGSEVVGDPVSGSKEVLTEALTDPMTVFYAMKQSGLLADDGDVVLHVVGAEPHEELRKVRAFVVLLQSLSPRYRNNLTVVLIGPLLTSHTG